MTAMTIYEALAAVGLLVIGAALKFLFDRWRDQTGYNREEGHEAARKVERVDSAAREGLARLERDIGGRLRHLEKNFERLEERVGHLPSADDMEVVARRLSELEREVAAQGATMTGVADNVRVIRDHILAGERRA